ncbi:MAG: GPR endopeptidase [Clostridia bacterium]|nr:GPR endopeptidase [Clostridia bacterium]
MAIRTDLALELKEMHTEEIAGVTSEERVEDGIKITCVKVENEEGARKIGKPVGKFITLEIDALKYEDDTLADNGAEVLSKEILKLMNLQKESTVLVVGLGNRYITPDSIGPQAVSKIFVTRHLSGIEGENFKFDFRAVSAIAPGVLGITGIETEETVASIVNIVKPDYVIAIDALASRRLSRLGTTIQLSDTGINPGSGVGNNRKELSEKSLGAKVIAIGVPMVVDASTLTSDIVENVGSFVAKKSEGKIFNMLGSLNFDERETLIGEAINEKAENMIVTPNNVDVIAKQAALIIAEGINRALHSELYS